jgi:hypothetical protein
MDERREVLVNRMRHLRQEIQSIFDDAEHWNRIHPDEQLIDPDEDWLLQRMADGLDASLAHEDELRAKGLT